MRRSAKIWLLIASILVVLGLMIMAGVMSGYDWDFSKLSTVSYETNTYAVSGDFDRISIHVNTTEVTFVLTDEDDCSIVCYEPENLQHAAEVQNGLLTIHTVDTSRWYDHIGVITNSPQMTVCLPRDQYAEVRIKTDTGDVFIPADFSFGMLEIESSTADVECFASVSEEMGIETDTGDIKLDGITAGKTSVSANMGDISLRSVTIEHELELKTDTGKIQLTDVKCAELQAVGSSGDLVLENTTALGSFSIETDTGDVYFGSSDAQEIFVHTNTGDVEGSLLTEKVFFTETDTGRVDVPKSITGGRCEITTDTGDIKLEIEAF